MRDATSPRTRYRTPRRPDEAADHCPSRRPRPAPIDHRHRARAQPTGHDAPAPPPSGWRFDPLSAFACRPSGRPLQHPATPVGANHRVVGRNRRRAPDRPGDRRRWPRHPRLTIGPFSRSFRLRETFSISALADETSPRAYGNGPTGDGAARAGLPGRRQPQAGAGVATSRIRPMSRCPATSALIISIFSRSAGCVLTSRSWTSEATT
jgi:hypothetical protein